MNEILTVAVVVAITAFFKKQLSLTGWQVILAAFIVALIIGLTPVIADAFPPIAPWLTAIVNVVLLFLTAAGSADFITTIRTKDEAPDPGVG